MVTASIKFYSVCVGGEETDLNNTLNSSKTEKETSVQGGLLWVAVGCRSYYKVCQMS